MGENTQDVSVSTLLIDVGDLASIVQRVGLDAFMDELIAQLQSQIAAFDPARVSEHIRTGFNYSTPETGLVEWMPAMVNGDVVSVKTVGYHPNNPAARNIPSVLATTALYSTETGALVGLTEATLLTALRTGAASAAVTAHCVPEGPIALGVVGCGAQAVTQIHAISRIRPIERLVVTDVLAHVAHSLAERIPSGIADVEVRGPGEFDSVVSELDVLCIATSTPTGSEPVVRIENPRPHLHVNAVGADFPGKTELHIDDLRRATVIPDVVDQCLVEGESQQLERDELGPSMVEVLGSKVSGFAQRHTIFDSTGWSYEDLVVARMVVGYAQKFGLGTSVHLQRTPADPYDTYESLRTNSAGELSQLRSA